nr:alkaline phosphatase family protein [Gimesia benthica]
MRKPLVVLNIVGLTHEMLGERTPNLSRLARQGFSRPMGTVLPAVTCSAQSTLLTGLMPRDHGIVANGWYFRDLAEVMFWKQSNKLVRGNGSTKQLKNEPPITPQRKCSGGITCMLR